jgi:hypothetical protein
MGQTTIERDGFELLAARRFVGRRWIAAAAVFHHFRGAFQRPDFADAGHIFAIPLQPELEILIRVHAARVDGKLSHGVYSL